MLPGVTSPGAVAAAEAVTLGPREQRRQRLLEVSREHLLDAAEEVFGEKGFRDATIKEIAERAEFSVGAVYGIVSGKEDLLSQTLRRRAVELLAAIDDLVVESEGGLESLHRLADIEIEFFRRHPHFGRLWLRWSGVARWGLAPESLERMGADINHAMASQAVLIEGGQSRGELRAGDPEVLARIFSGIIQAYQATDPASVGESGEERLSRAELHALIEGAFAR
jgi:TetR/AcrR family transcriptional regulator